ncbi:MAG: FtsQ-type POTRA domain-containing protein [Oscillospiraceae bacterium]|nr:FtsQ-type POTRA domain-containing protein [Oscillospiraceae bacterium]
MAAKKHRSRRRPAISLYAVFATVVMLVALVLGFSVFFRVNTVRVEGSSYYSEEEVLSVADIGTGNIIFFTGTDDARARLYAQMPYIYSVDIVKQLPDTVTIHVNESEAVAYIAASGKNWLIDEHGKVLGEMAGRSNGNYIRVLGITPLAIEEGKMLEVDPEQQTMLDALVNILTAIRQADVVAKVKNVDVSNISNATFTYDAIYEVDFGSGVDAAYKISKLINIVSQLEEGVKGRIDLSKEGRTHFIPA